MASTKHVTRDKNKYCRKLRRISAGKRKSIVKSRGDDGWVGDGFTQIYHGIIPLHHHASMLPTKSSTVIGDLDLACWIDGRFKEDAWIFSSGRVPSNYVFVHLFSTFSLQK